MHTNTYVYIYTCLVNIFLSIKCSSAALFLMAVGITWKHPNLFSHSLIVGHIGCSQFFAFVNKVLYTSLQIRCVHFPDYFLILDSWKWNCWIKWHMNF